MKTKISKAIILAAGFLLIFGTGLCAQAKSKNKKKCKNCYTANYGNYYGNFGYGNYGGYGYGYGSGYGNYYSPGYYGSHYYPANLDPSVGPYPGCWADPNQNRIFCNPERH